MKTLFPGYFTPTEEEFAALWGDALFGFDANVLLRLYRYTAETQQVFFDVLEKVRDRIFLPHQAGREYLKHRLSVISLRADSYGKIRLESEKLTKSLELMIQDHALPSGSEIVSIAKDAAKKIDDLVSAAEKEEPDLLRADALLTRLGDLFEKKTGQPFEQSKLKDIYADGARRYSHEIPPGYKDDKKPEPDRYGDLLIWLQLIDQAKLAKKPIIFVTGDVKEDWWLQHKGATLGPRPELRQEMMTEAGVHFYMYTATRFLEFAKQFLDLNFDTKKAETEFEEIEKQDKQTASQYVWHNLSANLAGQGSMTIAASNVPPSTFVMPTFPTSSFVVSNTPTSDFLTGSAQTGEWFQPTYDFSTFNWVPLKSELSNSQSNNEYIQLLPVSGNVFQCSTGKWACQIVNEPDSSGGDRVCYRLRFDLLGLVRNPRYLELWVSVSGLHQDTNKRYRAAIFSIISQWLSGNQLSGQISHFG